MYRGIWKKIQETKASRVKLGMNMPTKQEFDDFCDDRLWAITFDSLQTFISCFEKMSPANWSGFEASWRNSVAEKVKVEGKDSITLENYNLAKEMCKRANIYSEVF